MNEPRRGSMKNPRGICLICKSVDDPRGYRLEGARTKNGRWVSDPSSPARISVCADCQPDEETGQVVA